MRDYVVLLDLDDTLIVETASVEEAFIATCSAAWVECDVEPEALCESIRACAKELKEASEHAEYFRRVGVSSWECLWARFAGQDEQGSRLRQWAAEFRREAWTRALARHGVKKPALARELAELFPRERRGAAAVFSETEPALQELSERYRLGVVTNGLPCLQRDKVELAGIGDFFEEVIVSGDIAVGKPDPAIYLAALERFAVDPGAAVMVGNGLTTDVKGAQGAGLKAIWLNRSGDLPTNGVVPDAEIRALTELQGILDLLWHR